MASTLIIAAISSRAFVQAATQAGFKVIAIDAFADVDTQQNAAEVWKVPVIDGQFDADSLLKILSKKDLSDCLGICFGAGFEAQPNLLRQIATFLPVIGNTPDTIEKIKMPHTFFCLCDAVNMLYPVTQFERPSHPLGWLQKRNGGSGGAHIKPVLPIDLPAKRPVYYQKIQAGTPYSCLFIADGKQAQVIGFNEQWCNPSALLPYRYGGAVSHADIDVAHKTKVEAFIIAAAQRLGLHGMNSCDFLLHEDIIYMLEINPRLSATLDLYRAKKGYLFAAHVAACLGNLQEWPIAVSQSRAHHIVYANQMALTPPNMDWPEWVCDIPQANTAIAAGEPICSVFSAARTAKMAKKKVLERASSL